MFIYSYKQSWTSSAIITVDSVNRVDQGISNIETDNSGVFNISVFPNPVNKTLNINLESHRDFDADFRIIDMTGQVLIIEKHRHTIPNNSVCIDISALMPGLYMLNIRNEDIHKTVKFLKE